MEEGRRITGAAGVMGALTLASRVLGYLRDAVIAWLFGAGLAADAFFVAFRVANLLRRLVGEGALTSSFVPIFTEELERRSRQDAYRLACRVFTLFFLILLVLTLAGAAFAPQLVRLMSPGFAAGKFELTVSLTRLMFPYLLFIGLMAIAMGILNSFRHFTAPALAPVLLNAAVITAALGLGPLLAEPVYALAAGVVAGGLLQFALQLPFLSRYGMFPRPDFSFGDEAVRKILLLMGPAALGVGVYQLNIFVTLRFASELGEGSVSYLYYSGRLMELPLGVFAVSVSTAVLPTLAQQAAREEWTRFRDSLGFALRLVNFVSIPAAVGLAVLGPLIIDVLFGRGSFTAGDVSATAFALTFYALGVIPVASSRILASVFYSLKDTSTPVMVAAATFLFNIAMCMVLRGPLAHGGLALAATLSAALNTVLLLAVLRRRFGPMGARRTALSAARSLAASLVMGAALYVPAREMEWTALAGWSKALLLTGCMAAGVVVFVTSSMVLKVEELLFFKEMVRERIAGRRR
ncbi:MAG TPA: murein biosynthesis integral membrane protein MurJ [Deltaproteobacteria bacterium]|nr:murein biosynthesis integral membrane protein MurJ [Deltaproteobacteria bacterium]